jgi:hypothetical protein
MLTISKNKSKTSHAVVKFTRTKPAPKLVPKISPLPPPLPPPLPIPPPMNFGRGVQSNLTENTFRQYLVGFVQISPRDLPATIGKRVRYAIDTVDKKGRVISTKYRLGGIVNAITGDNVSMFNPSARKTWTLKITQPPGKRLRLYSNSPANKNAAIYTLMAKIQSGQLKLR